MTPKNIHKIFIPPPPKYSFFWTPTPKNIEFKTLNPPPHPPKNAPKIVSEYDQVMPQSQTAENPVAPRGRAAQPSRDTRKTN